MKRRELLKGMGLVAVATSLSPIKVGATEKINKRKRSLRIAHITDIHIRPEHDAPNRFRKCMEDIKKHQVDFFLNSGDTIFAADYSDIKRERVVEQWNIWKELRNEFSEYEVHSCLGNHDMWWAAPEKTDSMYGKGYVVEQLGIPSRFYSLSTQGWHFIILDSNNAKTVSLDKEQRQWLEQDLDKLPSGMPVLVMSHCPILGVSTILEGGNHTDSKYITNLFYQHNDKKTTCLSGHIHLLDRAVYNGVNYFCNGALSGFWWEEGNEKSSGKCWYHQTPPGYAIIDLYEDGSVNNTYYPHEY